MSNVRWQAHLGIWISVVTMALISGCGGSASTVSDMPAVSPNLLARYGDHELTVPEFESRYARSVGGREAAMDDSLAEYADFLERYVDFRLKVMEAKNAGLDQDPDLLAEIDQYKKQLSRPYLLDQELMERLTKDLYERQQEEVSASHILVRIPGAQTPADTLAAYQRMEMLRDSVLGGYSFADIARRNSEDPSAARNDGYLGVFTGGRMIKAFEDQAYATPVDSMSPIFRTRFGYHILQVHSRRPRSADRRAAHILIRTADDDTVQALEKVKEIQAKLANGADFGQLAREYSEDQGSAANGGDLGLFGRGRMVAPFEEAAFALQNVGDVSAPVRTRFGYHLIKLLGIGTLPTYDEAYEDLKTLIQRLPRYQQAENDLAVRYKEELNATIDTAAVERLTAEFSRDSTLFGLALKNWTDLEKEVVIATMGSTKFTLGDFLVYGDERRESPPPSFDFDETISTIDRMLTARALDVAASTLEEKDPDFRDLMDEYRDGIVLFRIMEDSVWNRANTDSVGLMKTWQASASSYRFPDRRRVIGFYSASDSLLKEISDKWTPGDTTDWAASIDEPGFRVDTTFVADSTNSVYDNASTLQVGETTEPIKYRRGYLLLAYDGLDAAREKTFKEARAEVVTAYQAKIEEEWLKRLRAKYGAVLYPENLTHVFAMADGTGMKSTP